MIEIAGGDDPFGRPANDSVRISLESVRAFAPEFVVVAPCGFGLSDAERFARDLPDIAGAEVRPVDANAFFARPGPRYAEGVELLSALFRSHEPTWGESAKSHARRPL
jgi:iron complex transport system substrate-binding protein